MSNEITIKTNRLVLREFIEDDFVDVHKYVTDPDVVRYMIWGPNTEKETREFLNRTMSFKNDQPRLRYELAIVLKSEKLIGGCDLTITDINDKQGYIGYGLNKDFWGNGYATEAAKALIKFGFIELDLHRIFATCDIKNSGSENVLKKIGMKKEGHLGKHKIIRGKWRDSYLYSILELGYEDNTC